MNLREVTIGRSRDCDIFLDPRCQYASGHHGVIYSDGNQLMFRDTSSNGTMINNISVRHRAVPIKRGDIIMLAGKYQLNWNQIDSFFPYAQQRPVDMGTIIERSPSVLSLENSTDVLNKWSWGAFGLYPLWGLFNGCWWSILVSFFFGFLYPIPNVIFGIYGNRWAWHNRTWRDMADFTSTQSKWTVWGIVFACLGLLSFLLLIFLYVGILMAL